MRSKKAILNVFSTLISQIVIILYGFIVPRIIINLYGSQVNGLISSIVQFLTYISLLESGVGPVIKATLYKPIARKDSKTITNILGASERFFKSISLIFIIYLIILSVVYPFVVIDEFDIFFTLSLIIIISISTFAEYFFGMTYNLYLQAEQKNYITSFTQIVTYLLSVIIIIILSYFDISVHLLKLISGLIFVLRPLLQNLYIKKKYNINLKTSDKKYKLEKKWDGLAQHIDAVVHNNTDITILTFFTNLIEVSVYSVYSLVVRGVRAIIQAFTNGIDALFGDMIARNEVDNLNRKFKLYEAVYFTIISIIYISTMVLITPFIRVYTMNITDANYVRPLFGIILVIGEFVYAIRLPYSSITLASGHFKETKKGAIAESIINIFLSIALVIKFKILGVAIGTLVAMLIRSCEFIYYANKHILKRNILKNIKNLFLIIVETTLLLCLIKYLPTFEITSYFGWILYALMVFCGVCIIILFINYVCYKKEFKELFIIIKSVLKKR